MTNNYYMLKIDIQLFMHGYSYFYYCALGQDGP